MKTRNLFYISAILSLSFQFQYSQANALEGINFIDNSVKEFSIEFVTDGNPTEKILFAAENAKTNFKDIEIRYRPSIKKAEEIVESNDSKAYWTRIAGRASGVLGGGTAAATASTTPATAVIAASIAGIGSLAQWLLGDENFSAHADKCRSLKGMGVRLDNFITIWEIEQSQDQFTPDQFVIFKAAVNKLTDEFREASDKCGSL